MIDELLSWFEKHPGTAGWVQGFGVLLALLVAIAVPVLQLRLTTRQAKKDAAQQERDHLSSMVAALRAEIGAALEAAERAQFAIDQVFEGMRRAKQAGLPVGGNTNLRGSLIMTDAIVYREVAGELGRFPPEVVARIVSFYTKCIEIPRLADMSSTALGAYEVIRPLLPRIRMSGELLSGTLKKLERQEFARTADLTWKVEEARTIAQKVGYPLDEVAQERGLKL